jgi:carbon-monoxide dehydrogenase medium subunit/6-hydroxypseudooxynicotine dehydrogenase subunit alpha
VKPPPFQLEQPRTIEDALALLDKHGEDGKVLAGGQSLVPLLNFRLATPQCLVDVNRLGELAFVRRLDGVLTIGALTRQSRLERSAVAAAGWPLLREATRHVAHRQIRNRGTVGGSVAHADPAAELPVALTALNARYRARSVRGERVIETGDMFRTHLTTALEPDELLLGIDVPPSPARSGSAFGEFALRNGDFALAGAAAVVSADPDGTCTQASLVLLAAAPVPLRADEGERLLVGRRLDAEAAAEAAEAATRDIEPTGDIHGSTRYRRRLMETVCRRVLEAAMQRVPAGGQ